MTSQNQNEVKLADLLEILRQLDLDENSFEVTELEEQVNRINQIIFENSLNLSEVLGINSICVRFSSKQNQINIALNLMALNKH